MKSRQIIILIVSLLVVGLVLTGYHYRRQLFTKAVDLPVAEPLSQVNTNVAATSTPSVIPPTTTPTTPPTPKPVDPVVVPKPPIVKNEINLAVPFQAQAPFGDWSLPYGEACEEASLIMVDHYLQASSLSKQQMKDAIDKMVAWQIDTWGGHKDLSVSQVVSLAKQFYPKYSYQVISGLTADKIREQLLLGRPVIVPAAGRELHNPNFKSPGPIYHMLVVKGFTKDGKFITNDPGTHNGADYVYTENVLMAAIHDWTGSAADGGKVGLVVYK